MTSLPPAIAQACTGLAETPIGPGRELIVQGAPGGTLFILIAGAVKVVRDDVEVACVTEPGAVFGEVPLLLGTPIAATVITLSDSRFYVIEDGIAFQRDNPEFTLFLCRLLALRVHLMAGYLSDLKTQFAEDKGHLGMVHEILGGLCQHPQSDVTLGSDRMPGRRR